MGTLNRFVKFIKSLDPTGVFLPDIPSQFGKGLPLRGLPVRATDFLNTKGATLRIGLTSITLVTVVTENGRFIYFSASLFLIGVVFQVADVAFYQERGPVNQKSAKYYTPVCCCCSASYKSVINKYKFNIR